jgi:hypothetical protein
MTARPILVLHCGPWWKDFVAHLRRRPDRFRFEPTHFSRVHLLAPERYTLVVNLCLGTRIRARKDEVLLFEDRVRRASVPLRMAYSTRRLPARSRYFPVLRSAGLTLPRIVRLDKKSPALPEDFPFPCFLREDAGSQGLMLLMKKPEDFDARKVASFRRPVAIEYVDTAKNGVFRKYRTLVVGDRALPHHLCHSTKSWVLHVKTAALEHAGHPEWAEEHAAFCSTEEPPSASEMIEGVRALGLDLGAYDFSIAGDRKPIVWEVNTVPDLYTESKHPPYFEPQAKIAYDAMAEAFLRWAGEAR